jgi:AcrR family transcriptional regulator
MTKSSLRSRKRQFVEDAIFDAAIELFAANGFDETTVEEVAQAAGISRASFFRYFSSKDDLLAQNVMKYGDALTESINECRASLTSFQVMHETVLSVAKNTVTHPRTRKVIDISQRSASARQAQMSRMVEVEERVASAYAQRIGCSSMDELEPRLLATLTLSAMNVAIMSWYRGEHRDLSAAVERVFSRLTGMVCERTRPQQCAGSPHR